QSYLQSATDDDHLFTKIVNAPFSDPVPAAFVFLGIVVLLQVNKRTKTIDRVALSETDLARNTTEVSVVPFHDIAIPLDHYENIIAHAIASGEPQDTTDWKFLFEPALSPEQARINQASAGIAYSCVFPLTARDGGAMIFSYFQYQHDIDSKQMEFMRRYSALVDAALAKKA
ncbi:MAG TPA: hypothetical protein VFH39_04920, partial [Candidatus Saccharimonadales bacterium]|nr:hypothetical protein [Candidatus Saccharimonadales bacterium]